MSVCVHVKNGALLAVCSGLGVHGKVRFACCCECMEKSCLRVVACVWKNFDLQCVGCRLLFSCPRHAHGVGGSRSRASETQVERKYNNFYG